MGFRCCGPASSSKTADPCSTAVRRKPMSFAAGASIWPVLMRSISLAMRPPRLAETHDKCSARRDVLRSPTPAGVRVHDRRDVEVARLGRRLGKERARLARQRHRRVRALEYLERQTEVFHEIVDGKHRRRVLVSHESGFARLEGGRETHERPEDLFSIKTRGRARCK